ncbi:alpha-L-fucosidase [Paludibaculum fermentans]|uniref:alpha-L-fucosidase n=1 Tax=Paludibaculum fermentans TaxID=1473598 RepID=UPI003EBC6053
MALSRRDALGILAAAPGLRLAQAQGQDAKPEIPKGEFAGTSESLRPVAAPDWFRDAKFGIWAHWGPQSQTEAGDWYAKRMYEEGSKQYQFHVKTYGHPSKFGFKDIIPTWKAEQFDAEHLMDLYQKAGAKYFVSMGVHHDNFDLWNSKFNRWNSVNMGPKKDVVGMFQKAAQKRGLKFGVSEHLAVSYHWYQTSHLSDKAGPQKGVPYDGADPKFWDYYHEGHEVPVRPGSTRTDDWSPVNVPVKWKQHYFNRIKDLVDNYHPDLLYTDGPIFFQEWGLSLIAHLYNESAKKNKGKVGAVYCSKLNREINGVLAGILDVERGLLDKIADQPWQTDTCIGGWHYNREIKYKSAKTVVDLLVDIVSRNGNLLLNFPLPGNGMLDSEELKTLDGITKWMAVNHEGIYGTRPWKIFGDGPGTGASAQGGGNFNERNRKDLGPQDARFISKGSTLYAFVMGVPDKEALIPALAPGGANNVGKIRNVELVGFKGKVKFTQEAAGLKVELPEAKPCEHALAFKIVGA